MCTVCLYKCFHVGLQNKTVAITTCVDDSSCKTSTSSGCWTSTRAPRAATTATRRARVRSRRVSWCATPRGRAKPPTRAAPPTSQSSRQPSRRRTRRRWRGDRLANTERFPESADCVVSLLGVGLQAVVTVRVGTLHLR